MLDQRTFATFDRLRKEHFPTERNFLPAHVTLFHALPGQREAEVRQVLQQTAGRTSALALSFPSLRFLGRGVAVDVLSSGLLDLRKQLAVAWAEWLSEQDRQKYRPHVTIQNKVAAEQAKELYRSLSAEWVGCVGPGEGLLLWRYLGGPWELAAEYLFSGTAVDGESAI